MSNTLLLHCNDMDAQARLVGELSESVRFRHYDLTDPVEEMSTSFGHPPESDEDTASFQHLIAHIVAEPESYALNKEAPLSDMLWRQIVGVVSRGRSIIITGLSREADLNWFYEKARRFGPVLRVRLWVKPTTPTDQLDLWKTLGIQSPFDLSYEIERFGEDELRQVLAQISARHFS